MKLISKDLSTLETFIVILEKLQTTVTLTQVGQTEPGLDMQDFFLLIHVLISYCQIQPFRKPCVCFYQSIVVVVIVQGWI